MGYCWCQEGLQLPAQQKANVRVSNRVWKLYTDVSFFYYFPQLQILTYMSASCLCIPIAMSYLAKGLLKK